MNQTISYVTREPIPTFLLWSTVISTFFMDVFRIEGVGEGRGGRKVNVLYTKRNNRDHSSFSSWQFLSLCFPRPRDMHAT